jgi:hypothetical protein
MSNTENISNAPLTPERVANQLYGHSYVTGLWRLSQEGLIPEGVLEVTSATLNDPIQFETHLGRYVYMQLNLQGFFGYTTIQEATPVVVATIEKALLDFFWWKGIEWDATEFARWRIQDPWKKIDHHRLHQFARQWKEPRLLRAAENLTVYLHAGG